MQTPLLIYLATVLGAFGVWLAMPKRKVHLPVVGLLVGLVALGGVWFTVGAALPERLGMERGAFFYHYLFSLIAIGAGVRVITHTKPVYAALWFVMVVLASAGLFLTLSSVFLAFAMVIIYAGAILVTYMFVIMLATQPVEEGEQSPEYERLAREPMLAVVAGFLLLLVVLSVVFDAPVRPSNIVSHSGPRRIASKSLACLASGSPITLPSPSTVPSLVFTTTLA